MNVHDKTLPCKILNVQYRIRSITRQRERGGGALLEQAGGAKPRHWSLDILEGPTWAKGLWFYQAAAAWTMVWQVAGALPVAKVIGLSASCLRNSVTKSRHEGRLAPRRHLGKGA